MPTTIDSLQIEIQSNSTSASAGIRDLAKSLGELKSSGTVTTAIKNLDKLSTSLRGFADASNATRSIGKLAGALDKLKSIGSVGSIGSGIAKLGSSLQAVGDINMDSVGPKIKEIAAALKPLSEVKAGGINTMVNGLSKLGKVTESLDEKTIGAFEAKIKRLNEVLGPLSEKMTTIQTGLRGISSKARSAGSSVKQMGDDIHAGALNFSTITNAIQTAVQWLNQAIQKFSEFMSQAIEWDGIAARFGRGFGGQAQETYEWIQRLNEEMGINTQVFMQYSSIYSTMLTGFGVAVEDATKMALGYTELTYDIWAGYNDVYTRFEDASEAVKSAIAGEVEPIRRAGFTIVESTLEQTAANHGLNISLEKATEAQKSYLRYLTLVDQAYSQNLVGTYAKELNTAEGLMRTFSQQVKSLTQAFGSLFLPVLVKVMPWLQAFVNLLTDAVRGVASFFGIEIQEVNWSGYNAGSDALDGVANSANDATKAVKELKNASVGIDELNVISPPSASSGGGGAGVGGAGAGFEGLDVNSLWDQSIFDTIQSDVDKIKSTLEDALADITVLISGFSLAVGTILVVTGANIPLGLGLMALGAGGLIAMITANWNTMSDELAKTLTNVTGVIGGFLLAIGALLAFTGVNVPLGIGLMAAGAVSFATAATINWKFLDGDLKNALSNVTALVGGALLAVGALFAFTGAAVPLGVALLVAGAVSLATAAALNWDSLSKPMSTSIGTLEAIVGSALLAMGALFAFTGVNIPLGIGLMAAGAVSLVSAVTLNWDSLTGPMKTKIATIGALVSGALIGVGAILAFTGVALPLGIAMMAAGAVGLVAAAPINWSGLVNSIKNVLKEIGIAVGASLLALGVLLCLTGVGVPLGIGLIVAGASSLVSGVALNWDTFKDIGKRCVDGIVSGFSDFGKKAKEIFGKFVKGVKDFLGIKSPSKVFGEIGGYCKQGLLNALGTSDIKNRLGQMWGNARDWWNSKKAALKTYTAPLGDIKSKLSSAWSSARSWWNSKKAALNSYTPSIGSIKDRLVSAWNTAKKWWNSNVRLSIPSLSFKVTYSNKGLNTVQKAVVKALGMSGWPKLSFAANGGIFDTGSLIWAGERGPEIMANAGGGRTGVMNVQQMQDAVYEGVYAAVVAGMRATAGGGNGSQSVNVYLDSRQITAAVEQRQRERGVSVMGSQVYSY